MPPRTRLGVEALGSRIVPSATVLNLATPGSQATAPTGAVFQQLGAGESGDTSTFLRLTDGFWSGLFGPERGYNTDARPLQFDAVGDSSVTRSLRLGEIPLVVENGVAYREFFLTANQHCLLPLLSLDELRVFLGNAGDLSGYSTSTNKLAGQSAVFDLDAGGNVSVALNDRLNRSGSADVRVLIPEAAFAGATPDTFVYLYSRFGDQWWGRANGGAESWSVAPVGTDTSISGFVYLYKFDMDSGEWVVDRPLKDVTVRLSWIDGDGFEQELVTTTDKDGKFSFTGLEAGTYTLREVQPDQLTDGEDVVGTAGGTASHDEGSFEDVITDVELGAGQVATGYLFTERPGD
jgi:hypothetical protein